MSQLKAQLQADMKEAMKAKAKDKLLTIRMILAGIKQKEIDGQITLDDTQVTDLLTKMVKQRRDAIKQYQDAGREELAAKEQAEIEIIQIYLPEAMSEADIEAAVKQAIADSGAASMQDMGKVMAIIKPALAGRADMGVVSKLVRSLLSQ